MKKVKLIKNQCEIDGCQVTDPKLLHLHHIIERTEENTNNDPMNLAILCPNHHAAHHNGTIKILYVYPSTKQPNNRILVYEINGVKNLDIDQPYCEFKNIQYKILSKKDEDDKD